MVKCSYWSEDKLKIPRIWVKKISSSWGADYITLCPWQEKFVLSCKILYHRFSVVFFINLPIFKSVYDYIHLVPMMNCKYCYNSCCFPWIADEEIEAEKRWSAQGHVTDVSTQLFSLLPTGLIIVLCGIYPGDLGIWDIWIHLFMISARKECKSVHFKIIFAGF